MPSAGTATFIKTAFFFSRVWRIFLWLVGQQRLICLELEVPQDLSAGVECPSGTCELLTSTNVPVHYYTITVMSSWTVPELLCTRAPSVLPLWHLLCSGHEFAAMIRTLTFSCPTGRTSWSQPHPLSVDGTWRGLVFVVLPLTPHHLSSCPHVLVVLVLHFVWNPPHIESKIFLVI